MDGMDGWMGVWPGRSRGKIREERRREDSMLEGRGEERRGGKWSEME
jgi:hypothetical protein